MAFPLKSLSVLHCLLLLLLQLSDGFNAEKTISCVNSLKETNNRKLVVMKGFEGREEAVFKVHLGKSKEEENDGWELRAAPLGPDPLHHHGAEPKKPRTP